MKENVLHVFSVSFSFFIISLQYLIISFMVSNRQILGLYKDFFILLILLTPIDFWISFFG